MVKKSSVSLRLALRFTLLVTIASLVLSVAFSIVLGVQLRSQKDQELQDCEKIIEEALLKSETEFNSLPYYITYVLWKNNEKNQKEVISTNDPFLPLLEETGNKSRAYIAKNYFIDGDLNILYFAKKVELDDTITIQICVNMDTDSTRALNKQIPRVAIIAFFPILLISFFVSLFMTRHTMAPVVKMTNTAKEITSESLEKLLPVSIHNDELDELAKTFNELFAKLKNDFDRERQFTSDVSHELKTPVAVILGQANLLRRWGKDDPVQLSKSLETIIGETKSMQSIIENLLQMSRLESGRVKPELVSVDVNKLFERIKTETESLVPETDFDISCEDTVSVLADEELLHQVLTVVISNSLKYTTAIVDPDGTNRKPAIKAVAEKVGDRTVLKIEDNGNGFDESSIEQVFERFFRQDSSHTRTAGGSGLGLSIARTIVQTMNGTITAYNTQNHGAGIKIELNSYS